MTRLMACRGCGKLVAPGPRCSACRRSWERQYDHIRPEHHALYGTAEWRRLSAEVRAGASRCTYCLLPTRRLVADHIIPLDQRPDLALERSNLAPACFGCNRRRAVNARLPDLADPLTTHPRPTVAARVRTPAPQPADPATAAVGPGTPGATPRAAGTARFADLRARI
jgi:5-methylcytosine-specific restriction endonuclease McrA